MISRHRMPPNQSGVPFLSNDFLDDVRYTISKGNEVLSADVRYCNYRWYLWLWLRAGYRQGRQWHHMIFGIDADHVLIKVVDYIRNVIDIE